MNNPFCASISLPVSTFISITPNNNGNGYAFINLFLYISFFTFPGNPYAILFWPDGFYTHGLNPAATCNVFNVQTAAIFIPTFNIPSIINSCNAVNQYIVYWDSDTIFNYNDFASDNDVGVVYYDG